MSQSDRLSIVRVLARLAAAAEAYAADQSGAIDARVGLVQPVTVAEATELNEALQDAWQALRETYLAEKNL